MLSTQVGMFSHEWGPSRIRSYNFGLPVYISVFGTVRLTTEFYAQWVNPSRMRGPFDFVFWGARRLQLVFRRPNCPPFRIILKKKKITDIVANTRGAHSDWLRQGVAKIWMFVAGVIAGSIFVPGGGKHRGLIFENMPRDSDRKNVL